MKVLAVDRTTNYPKFIAELSEWEMSSFVRNQRTVSAGSVVNINDICTSLSRLNDSRDAMKDSATKLRTLADMLDGFAPTIEKSFKPADEQKPATNFDEL